MRHLLRIVAVVLGVVLLGVGAAGAQMAKMTIAAGNDPNFAAFFVAKEAGICARNGLDVTVKTGPSGSAMVPLLIGNELQAAMGSAESGISSFNISNGKVVMVASASHLIRYFAIVSKAEIKTFDQLKGKKVGVAAGTGSEHFWLQVVKAHNLNPADYTIVQVDAPEMLAAVERGNIDGFSVWEPWVSRGTLALGQKIHVLRDSAGIFSPQAHMMMNREWIEKNRETAERFMKCMVETSDYIIKNPKDAAAHTARFLRLDQTLTELLFTKLEFRMAADQLMIQGAVDGEDNLKKVGKLTKPVDWKNFIYDGLLRQVRPEAVSYTLPK
jgi:NitT/TauT family transport system substrate-binding protein